jgi:hypothetical protein
LDWEALKAKRIRPPYTPEFHSLLDVSHFDSKYTQQELSSDSEEEDDCSESSLLASFEFS